MQVNYFRSIKRFSEAPALNSYRVSRLTEPRDLVPLRVSVSTVETAWFLPRCCGKGIRLLLTWPFCFDAMNLLDIKTVAHIIYMM